MERTLLTPEEAADRIGIDVDDLTALRTVDDGPDYYTVLVRVVRYDPESVDDFARRRQSADAPADPSTVDDTAPTSEADAS